MATQKQANRNGKDKNVRRSLPSWMSSHDKNDPVEDVVTNILSTKGSKETSNMSNVNKKSAAQHEITSRIDASCFSKLLEGVVFVLSGFVNPERSMLRSQALEMGAEYQPDWDFACTLLVCAFPNTPKFRQVANDCGTIVSKDWIVDCYNQKKLVEIDSYLMHAGRPWRKTHLENSSSHFVSETMQRLPATKSADSTFSKGKNSIKNSLASSKVKELAFQDLKYAMSWLENQEEKPESSEIKKIAAGGIIICLQDVIDALKENQDVNRAIGDWKFVPRMVEELEKLRKEKVGRSAMLSEELYELAVTCKRIYEKEFESIEKSEPVSKKPRKDVQIDNHNDYDSEKTEIMTDDEGSDSDATIELTEEELKVAHDRILAKHTK